MILENPESNEAWEQRLGWIKSSEKYRNFDRIDGEPMEFEWIIFPSFNTLQLSEEVKSLLHRLGETPEISQGEFIYVDVQRHFLWINKQRKRVSGKCQTRIFVCKKIWKRTMVIHWSWF